MGVVLSFGAMEGAFGATEGAWRVEVREPDGSWCAVETELVLTADGRRNLHVVPDEVSAVYDGPARWSRHASGRPCANHVVKAACARVPWRKGLRMCVRGAGRGGAREGAGPRRAAAGRGDGRARAGARRTSQGDGPVG